MKHILFFITLLLQTASPLAAIEPLDKIIVVVNTDVITQYELESKTNEYRKKLQLHNLSEKEENTLTSQVLQKMIRSKIQLQRAEALGIKIGDVALTRILEQIADNNKLTLKQLGDELKKDGLNFSSFREQTREELIIKQLQERVISSKVTVSDQEIQQFINIKNTNIESDISYHLSHILISTPESAKPTDVQLAKEKADEIYTKLLQGSDFAETALNYSNGRNALKGGDLGTRKANELPAVFVTAINQLTNGDITKPIRSASGFHILKINKSSKGKNTIEQTHARHILIRTGAKTSDEKARKTLLNVKQQIIDGGNFAQLAAQHSQDPGSKDKGGDLGWTSPGTFVKEFEDVMSHLKAGQVSEPFKSQFGWHIIQLLETRSQENNDDNLRLQARRVIHKRKAEEEIDLWIRRIHDESFIEYKVTNLEPQ